MLLRVAVLLLLVPQADGTLAERVLLKFAYETPPPAVIWSESINGLSLGIRKPKHEFFLTDGKLKGINIEIWLRNSSVMILKWSNSRDAWSLAFSSPSFKPSVLEAYYSFLPPERGKPLDLAASESVNLEISLAWAHWIWPILKSGDYQIQMSYDPRGLRNAKAFDVPGFWLGELTGPRLIIQLKVHQ